MSKSAREILETAADGKTVSVTLKASTGKGDARTEKEFDAKLPKSLRDAVDLLGEKQVFRFMTNALVIDLQGEMRADLQPAGETKGRKKAPYLEQLGF